MDPNKHLYIAYSENIYDAGNDIYYPLSQVLLDAINDDPRTSDSLIFDMNRHTIYAKGKEFGGLTPVFNKVNSPVNVTPAGINVGNSTAYFVTSVSQDKFGQISYTYAYTYFQLDFTYNSRGINNGTYIITNDSAYNLVTNVWQENTGRIAYSYITLKTNFTYEGDNVPGLVSDINVDIYGKISYIHKNLSVNSGIYENEKLLHNSSSYKLINNISQNADGTISYTYITLSNSFGNAQPADDTNVNYGVLTEATIDATGKLSTKYKNLVLYEGLYNTNVTNNRGVHLANGSSPTTYTLVLNGITQNKYGKISYSYTSLYTDPVNYPYHSLTIQDGTNYNNGSELPDYGDTNNVSLLPTTDFVNVLKTIETSNSGLSSLHEISYTLVQLPSKQYVDGQIDQLLLNTDAMRYAGTAAPSNTQNGHVNLTIRTGINNQYASSRGAIYKVSGSGYVGTEYVTAGDMIISGSDINIINKTGSTYYIDAFVDWDIINNNVNLVTDHTGSKKNGSNIITGVKLYDDGLFSYSTYTIGVQNAGSFSSNIPQTSETGKSKDITLLYNSTDTNAKGYRVITGVELTQVDLDTKLTYTYAYIYAGQHHHSTIKNQSGGQSHVIGKVDLSVDGLLSYTYVNIAQAQYHYPVTTTPGTYYNFNKDTGSYTFGISYDSKGHITAYSYTFVTDKHLALQTASSSVAQTYWFAGFVTGANPGTNGANYNAKLGSVNTSFPSFDFGGTNGTTFNINSDLYLDSNNIKMHKNSDVVITLPENANANVMFYNLQSLWGEL